MTKFVVISIVLSAVLLRASDAKYVGKYIENTEAIDIWNWGTTTSPLNKTSDYATQQPTELVTVTTEAPNPCLTRYEPRIPNFNLLGKRLSDVKCSEYIFGIEILEENERLKQECNNKKQGTYSEIESDGGRDTTPRDYPHMVAIGWPEVSGGWMFICGGTLISDRFVLTAAHCSKLPLSNGNLADVEPKIVRVGDRNIIDDPNDSFQPITVNIKRFIKHPKYKPPKKYFDIALIELERPVVFSKYVYPACLGAGSGSSHKELLYGKKAILTGWGFIDTATTKTSPEVQIGYLEILNSSLCDKLLTPSCNRHWCKMLANQLCASKLVGRADVCQGDSGSPLSIKTSLPPTTKSKMHRVVGVTSFGIGCARLSLPAVYSRVDSFLGWIEEIVWK